MPFRAWWAGRIAIIGRYRLVRRTRVPHAAMSSNHVAVITGGASGIGLAAAMRFAARWARLSGTTIDFDFHTAEATSVIASHSFAISPHVFARGFRLFPALSNQRAQGGRAPDAPDSRVCKW
jgi:hypothetical protein